MPDAIAIIGYGELGKQFEGFLKSNSGRFIFFDDQLNGKSENIFPFGDYEKEEFSNHDFFVALGYHNLERKKIITDRLLKLGRYLPPFRHPSCFINASVKIGEGTFIYPMCNVDKETKIGKGV